MKSYSKIERIIMIFHLYMTLLLLNPMISFYGSFVIRKPIFNRWRRRL